jgi:hypothetical protein
VASLNLFIFTLIFYTRFFSFDWVLLEYIFGFLVNSNSPDYNFILGLVWYILLFTVFTKCGLAPFFFWKPTFFKGLTINSIFFYICIFYFFIFLFFMKFISLNFHFIFFYYHGVFIGLVVAGLLVVMMLMLESFYLKVFFAVSSILNSLIIFLAMSSPHILSSILF